MVNYFSITVVNNSGDETRFHDVPTFISWVVSPRMAAAKRFLLLQKINEVYPQQERELEDKFHLGFGLLSNISHVFHSPVLAERYLREINLREALLDVHMVELKINPFTKINDVRVTSTDKIIEFQVDQKVEAPSQITVYVTWHSGRKENITLIF